MLSDPVDNQLFLRVLELIDLLIRRLSVQFGPKHNLGEHDVWKNPHATDAIKAV